MSQDTLLALADELYGLPLAEFTPARDALAKERRGEDRDLAAAVKALKKASVAAWVVNLLVRRDPEQVEQVLTVGAALREAAESLDAAQLRELTKQRRQLTAAVTTAARKYARMEGVKVTQAAADQVEATLTAAMIDADAARAVRSGLLITPVAATGVGDLDLSSALALPEALGFEASAQPVAQADPSRRPDLRVVPDPDADAKARVEADAAIAVARAALEEARAHETHATGEVEHLQARTLQLQAELDELRGKVAEVEESLDETDDELGDAEEAQARARESLATASADLSAAEKARTRIG